MSRLLSASFVRLFKNKSFWLCNIFMVILAVVSQFMNWVEAVSYGSDPSPDTTFFFYSLFLGILLSAFISLFIGAEYSSGAMRNKLIIGHSRAAIYLSGLITCIAASAVMCLFYLAAALAVGLPLSGFFDNDIKAVILTALGIFFMGAAFSALCTCIAMLCQSRAVTAVINILLVFILLFAAIYIRARLEQPPTYQVLSYSADGSDSSGENVAEMANPMYLEGTEREVYEVLNDLLPTGQSVQYVNMEASNPMLLMAYSAGVTVVVTAVGIFLFRKKDLR